jgi:hypothetical protein
MQVPLVSDESLWQRPIALERALFCLDCEVIFTAVASCPSCSSKVVWPLARWLSPGEPRLIPESRPAGGSPVSEPEAADAKAAA